MRVLKKKNMNLITNEDYLLITKKQKQLRPFASRFNQIDIIKFLKSIRDIKQESLQNDDFDPVVHLLDLNYEMCQ